MADAETDHRAHSRPGSQRRPVVALACDLRYAAETAIFTTAFARVAFAGDTGGTWCLTRLVGPAKAKELYYFSERLTADEAEKLGLVNAVFPAGGLEKEVMDRAGGWPRVRRLPTAT